MFNPTTKSAIVSVTTIALSTLCSLSSYAQNYSITSAVTAAYQTNGTQLGALPNINSTVGQPYVYQVDFTLHAGGFSGNQRGFGSLVFNIATMGSSLTNPAGFPSGYQPDFTVVDTNGPTAGGNAPLWEDNDLFGSDVLASIAVIPTPHAMDPRPLVGQGAGTLLGSLFVQWDGVNVGSVDVNMLQAAYVRADNGQLVVDGAINLSASPLIFGVPEPTTVALLGLSLPALGWMVRRKRKQISSGL